MRSHRPAAPRGPRVRARTAAIGAFVVLAAMVPAAAAVAGPQEVDTELPYVCTLPSGKLPATVRVSATFPDRANPGEAFSPTDVATTVELPAEAVADLTALKAATVQPATRLTVDVTQNEAAAEATWRGTAEPVALPESGPLTLTTTGDVPSVTGQGDGDLTFSAGNLAVDMALATADGAAAEPGSVTVDCSPAEDTPDKGLLATVPIGSAMPEPSGPPSGPHSPSGPPGPSSSGPADEPERQRRDRAPEVEESTPGGSAEDRDAPQCLYDDENPFTPTSYNAYVTGYTNVNKLKGATLIPPYCMLIEQGDSILEFFPDFSGYTLTQHSTADFDYEGRKQTPPYRSTFLTFDFTPVTATMVLEQVGPVTVDTLGVSYDMVNVDQDTYIRVPLVLRMTALEVNGVPLDVGPDCRTERPLTSPEPEPAKHPGDHLVLHGETKFDGQNVIGYTILSGGRLTGEVAIPAFTGCGTADGENLDRLLTASVSGPGNYVKQIQGQTCNPNAPQFGDGDLFEAQCTRDLQPYEIPVAER